MHLTFKKVSQAAGLLSSHTLELWPCKVAFDGRYDQPPGFCTSFSCQAITLVETTLTTSGRVRRSFCVHTLCVVKAITTSKRRFLRQVVMPRFWTAWKIARCDVTKREALKSIDSLLAFRRWSSWQSGWLRWWKTKCFWKIRLACVRYSQIFES